MTRIELTELVVSAQNGDKSALEKIYLFTRSAVMSKAVAATRNLDDAEDILQSCYLTVIAKLGDLKDPESFEKWFNILVTNKIRDFKKKKAPLLLDESDYNSLSNAAETNSDYIPHESFERKENRETVRVLVDELDEKKRTSIEMHYFDGKSVSQIADELGIPENTVKTRLHCGRNEIRNKANKSAKKLLLTILILILLLVITALCVTSNPKYRFSMNLVPENQEIAGLFFENKSNEESCDTIIHKPFEPTYIPEGFELSNFDTIASWLSWDYTNDRNSIISIQQHTIGKDGWTIDASDVKFKFKYISGYKVLFSYKENNIHCIWNDDENVFTLSIPKEIPEEEIEKIIAGLKPMF